MLSTKQLQQQVINLKKVRNEYLSKKNQKQYFGQHAHELKPLHPSETVSYCVNDRWLPGVVVRRDQTPQSYIVVTANGMHYKHNRKHSQKRPVRLARPETVDKPSS